ncbi:HU family DNA-binding protein [Desulfobaculum bizertense]|uniref:DNA-binding protein HU-beta n=1 Tax=Desulfobaculum bizertense DSM 18034 TaxID=1121442 RepID=A0A1T4W8Z2_9BACT|nr:HU family DNA-binding protein [Desulfobaculum bizertense]UIJ39233.1 HU family DNA-binding protein [Desulfobaculum bizertense]SKA73752.1 DNA-binding protein HU-beta [Desulfobaculum bizertense DSM 18034]
MTKAGMVEQIKEKADLQTKVLAEKVYDAVLESVRDALVSGESAMFTGLGSFRVVQRAERAGRNPGTGEVIRIPSCKVVRFTPGKKVKAMLS